MPVLGRISLTHSRQMQSVNNRHEPPSPGGQAKGMTKPGMMAADGWVGRKVWHPLDLPKGYHTASRVQS